METGSRSSVVVTLGSVAQQSWDGARETTGPDGGGQQSWLRE
jgi:hypothetical protein